MGFIDALRRVLSGGSSGDRLTDRDRLAAAWGLDDEGPSPEFPDGRGPAADPARMARPPKASDYDREQWRKKLRRILADLPGSQGEWDGSVADADALGLDRAWTEQAIREEFTMLVRRAVGDQVVTLQEHRVLELARSLTGIPGAEAEAILHQVVGEAEAFFHKKIEGA